MSVKMSNIFRKNFDLFFSKTKCSPATVPAAPPATGNPDKSNSDFSSTSISLTPSSTADDYFSSSSDDSISDFAAVFASHRFFFSSPGCSNSIFEHSETRPASGSRPGSNSSSVAEALKVPKYSLDPCLDFRRSMQEMIEARDMESVRSDWDYLNELLSCYLRLNPKPTHKFIITAFADLILCLLAAAPTPAADRPEIRRKYFMLR